MSTINFSPGNNLASTMHGGEILFATDDFFGIAENLIKDEEPEWREKEYTEFGKWMDGWETRRKRKPGHDFCIIKLAEEISIEAIDVDTAFFTGNHPPSISIQAATVGDLTQPMNFQRNALLGSEASEDQISLAKQSDNWKLILPVVALNPGYPDTKHNIFDFDDRPIVKYLRLNLFPDGGVARLRVFGQFIKTAILNGGLCVAFSNAHFGHPKNLIAPGASSGMHDGWETARQRNRPKILELLPNGFLKHTGSEWVIIKFAMPSLIQNILVDTQHFKGNYPDLIQIEASDTNDDPTSWNIIVPLSKLSGDRRHSFAVNTTIHAVSIKIIIQPDGGISRIRAYGIPLFNKN